MSDEVLATWLSGKPGNTDQALAAFEQSGQSRDYLVGMIAGASGMAVSLARVLEGPSADVVVGYVRGGAESYLELLAAYDAMVGQRAVENPVEAAARTHWEQMRQGMSERKRRKAPPWEELPEASKLVAVGYMTAPVQAALEAEDRARKGHSHG